MLVDRVLAKIADIVRAHVRGKLEVIIGVEVGVDATVVRRSSLEPRLPGAYD